MLSNIHEWLYSNRDVDSYTCNSVQISAYQWSRMLYSLKVYIHLILTWQETQETYRLEVVLSQV